MSKTVINEFTVWIDEKKRIVSLKEILNYTSLVFENKEKGLSHIQQLIAKGYKIG